MARVFVSSVVNAPIEDVWAKIRDFNGLPQWHPTIVDSHIEDGQPSDTIGCVRSIDLKGGGNIREQLLALSDEDHLCTYTILTSPLALETYVATLHLLPITDGNRTYGRWTAEFKCPAEEEEGLKKLVGEAVFQAGFDALKAIFGG
jgi:hypothetical protein